MRQWTAQQIADAAGARLLRPTAASGPERVTIDSRGAEPGTLFVGLRGTRVDGGRFAGQALVAGAWGVLVAPSHAEAALATAAGAVLAAEEPLAALQRLATAWRRELRSAVIGVTGSTGKTSTKDLLHAILAPHRLTVASRANLNTEIGLPLEILAAPAGTEVLVLEMAMRGTGQIAELARIAEPDVGVIVSIGPVHLELLGTLEAIAAAKAELLWGLRPGAVAVVPAGERLLAPHLRPDLEIVTFGEGGDVRLAGVRRRLPGGANGSAPSVVEIDDRGERVLLEVSFTQAHLRRNLLAAVAAAKAIGVDPGGRVEATFSPGRGQRTRIAPGITLIDDCYNANPMSMRAALDDLAETAAAARSPRRVAILGDMLELGSEARRYHAEIGAHCNSAGVDLLIAVGPLAEAMTETFEGESHHLADAAEAAMVVPQLLAPGDVVLVKGSRAVGLELVCGALRAGVGV